MKSRNRRILLLVPVIAAIVLIISNRHRTHIRSSAAADESGKVTVQPKDSGEFVPEQVNQRATASEREAENPFNSLKSRFIWKKTLFNKAAVSGYIRNTARNTKFRHVQARLEVLDDNEAIIYTEDLELKNELLPGDSVKVMLKSEKHFRHLKEVRLVVISAIPQRI